MFCENLFETDFKGKTALFMSFFLNNVSFQLQLTSFWYQIYYRQTPAYSYIFGLRYRKIIHDLKSREAHGHDNISIQVFIRNISIHTKDLW